MTSPSRYLTSEAGFQESQVEKSSITCTPLLRRYTSESNHWVMNFFVPLKVHISESGGSYGAGLSSENLPMHGLGYGLPLSRLYARYFNGDLQIASVDGHGTNVYVYLQRLSHRAQENIPVYNARSSKRLKNVATQVADWTDDRRF